MDNPSESLGGRGLLALTISAVAFAIFLLFYVRGKHPFYRVPFWRIFGFFLYGAIVAPIAALVSYRLLSHRAGNPEGVLGAFLVIGPLEELIKFAGPLILVGSVRRWREEPFEWFIAGAAAGTGFATTENILYAIAAPKAFEILALRSLAPMHLLWSGWLGYRIGRRSPGILGFVKAGIAGLFIASFLHGLWDALCFAGMGGLLFTLFGGQILAFGWHVRKMSWLCANRSPRRPDIVADATAAPRITAPDFRCSPCSTPLEKIVLRGVDVLGCPGCGKTLIGHTDLFRLVAEYSGSRGWFDHKAWYGFYWQQAEGAKPILCGGCDRDARLRRFLREDGPSIGFCEECSLATGDRKDVLALVELFRTRLEIRFIRG